MRKNRDVSSTKESPILLMCMPDGEWSLKQEYFLAIDHRIVSSTRVHMQGEAPDPCPVPRIRQIWLLIYACADMPCPVFSL